MTCSRRRIFLGAGLAGGLLCFAAIGATRTPVSGQPGPQFPQCTAGVAEQLSRYTYEAGWNLIGVPDGSTITNAVGPRYTLPPGSSDYEAVPPAALLRPGTGYWAYFASTTSGMFQSNGPETVEITVPPQQWTMVGNPRRTPVTLAGADLAYAYDPSQGYTPVGQLATGQGAWVYLRLGQSCSRTAVRARNAVTCRDNRLHLALAAGMLDPAMTSAA